MPLVRRLTPESIVIEMDVQPVPLVLLDGLELHAAGRVRRPLEENK